MEKISSIVHSVLKKRPMAQMIRSNNKIQFITIAAQQVGAVAQQAEDKKTQKYKHLSSHLFFTPVAIETSGVYGQKTTDFIKELGHRLRQVSGEANSFQYLAQRLSVAIQRGNSASVMGTMNGDDEEFFFV